jgi:D-alanyl-D-alanine carboxypeptidase
VKNTFIKEKADFVLSDLSKMTLGVYAKGELVEEVPILTKGRDGSWWETPAGLYKVEGKEKNHFSSFGRVNMPWSMPFQGNFFIHGWPYYPDGTPVDSRYSGGCIRVSTEDAKKVYDLVKVGTPILVFEKDFNQDDFTYAVRPPAVTAESYLAADLKSNFVFTEKDSKVVRPIASVTKLITALVATEYINMESTLSVAQSSLVPTSKPRLKVGEKVSVFNLLHLLLLESSNEAANVLAKYLGPVRFVDLMNQKAKSLGMTQAAFVDPAGSEAENVASAEDLFNLSKSLYNNRSFLLKMTAGDLNYSVYGSPAYSDLDNFNVFEDDPSFVGGKVGETIAAKQTILSIFELNINGEKRPIVIIALGSTDRAGDAKRILDYVKGSYAFNF